MKARRVVCGVAALATGLVLASTSTATAGVVGGGGRPGDREFVPFGGPAVFTAGTACDFAVTISEVANAEYARTFPNGNVLVTGRLVVRVTNDATGRAVVRNISGPTLTTTGPAGEAVVVLNGSSLSPVFEGNDLTGEVGRGLFVFHGPTVFTDFRLTSVSGAVEDLCEVLG